MLPANAANQAITWTSSNTAYATVAATCATSALVTGGATGGGSSTITVTTVDGSFTATITIWINLITFTPSSFSVAVLGTQQMSYTVYPTRSVSFSVVTGTPAQAQVSATGLVQGLYYDPTRTSTVVLTTIPDGRTATATVSVTAAWVVQSMFFASRDASYAQPRTIRGLAFSTDGETPELLYQTSIQSDSAHTQSVRAIQGSLLPANPDTVIMGNGYPQGAGFSTKYVL